jgi:hypothetical protein
MVSGGLSVVICVGLVVSVVSEPRIASETARVRAFEPDLTRLLAEGVDRSPTFRRLVEHIDRTDGIVYVETGKCSISGATGCLVLTVRAVAHTRYLRIHVTPRRLGSNERIAIIGHELQHANELLDASWVQNDADAYALFIRIGSAESIRSFETAEAQRVGAAVARELATQPPP